MKNSEFDRFADMFKREYERLVYDWNKGSLSFIQFNERQEELERIKTSTIQIFMESNKNFSPSKFRNACIG